MDNHLKIAFHRRLFMHGMLCVHVAASVLTSPSAKAEHFTVHIATEPSDDQSLVLTHQYDLNLDKWETESSQCTVPGNIIRISRNPVFPLLYCWQRLKNEMLLATALRTSDKGVMLAPASILERTFVTPAFPVPNLNATHWLVAKRDTNEIDFEDVGQVKTLPLLPKSNHLQQGREDSVELMELSGDGKWLFWSQPSRSRIDVFRSDVAGEGKPVASCSIREEGVTPLTFKMHPGGRFLLGLSQSGKHLSVFRFDPVAGRLDLIQILPLPTQTMDPSASSAARLMIQPGGELIYAFGLEDGSVKVIGFNPTEGAASALPTKIAATHINALAFDPSGRRVIVTSKQRNDMSVFRVRQSDGQLEDCRQTLLISKPTAILVIAEQFCCGS